MFAKPWVQTPGTKGKKRGKNTTENKFKFKFTISKSEFWSSLPNVLLQPLPASKWPCHASRWQPWWHPPRSTCSINKSSEPFPWYIYIQVDHIFLTFWKQVSCIPAWPQTCCVAKGALECLILQLLPPECWGLESCITTASLCGTGDLNPGLYAC